MHSRKDLCLVGNYVSIVSSSRAQRGSTVFGKAEVYFIQKVQHLSKFYFQVQVNCFLNVQTYYLQWRSDTTRSLDHSIKKTGFGQ